MQKTVSRVIDEAFTRVMTSGAGSHLSHSVLENQAYERLARAQKRKMGERDDPSDTPISTPSRQEPSTVAAPQSTTNTRRQHNVDTSSPLAVRRRSGIWESSHLQKRASIRRLPMNATSASEASKKGLTATLNGIRAQATLSRSSRHPSAHRRSSTRPPPFGLTRAPRHVSLSVESPATRSQMNMGGVISSVTTKPPLAIESLENALPVRITRSSLTKLKELGLFEDNVPLNTVNAPKETEIVSPRAETLVQSRNGPHIEHTRTIDVPVEPAMEKAPDSATMGGTAGTTAVSKSEKKATSNSRKAKSKGSSDRSRKDAKSKKGKMVPGARPPDLGSTGASGIDKIVEGGKEPSAKRQKATISVETATTGLSTASEHGPPNSPSRPTSTIDQSPFLHLPSIIDSTTASLIELSPTRRSARLGSIVEADSFSRVAQTPKNRLIDLRSSSPFSEEADEATESLNAALAHITSDVDFMHSHSVLPCKPYSIQTGNLPTKSALDLNLIGGLPTSDTFFVPSLDGIRSGISVS